MDVANIPYDVVAKAESNDQLTKEQLSFMLQSLLADRFQLQLHHERKEVPAYALVVGKKGTKLTESASDAKNSIRFRIGGVKGSLVVLKETMAQFVLSLSNEIGHPVLDKTGLTGSYDFTLEWTRVQKQLVGPPPAAEPNSLSLDANGPSIFTAVQEQLGLRLEPQKSSIDFLIIDHLAKPSEN